MPNDEDCEEAVNNHPDLKKPVFTSEKVSLGGMWQKARTGARPFSPYRLTVLASVAEKMGFWQQSWRELTSSYSDEDIHTLFVLAMLAVDGFSDQSIQKQKFKVLRTKLMKCLKSLAECQNEFKFQKLKTECVSAMDAWAEFTAELELSETTGFIGLRPDLEGSFEEKNAANYYRLEPARVLKLLPLLRFNKDAERLQRLQWQVWSLHFYESFMFDIASAKKHAQKP